MSDLQIPDYTYIAWIYRNVPKPVPAVYRAEVAKNITLEEAHIAIRSALEIEYPQAWEVHDTDGNGKQYTAKEMAEIYHDLGASAYHHRYAPEATIAQIGLSLESVWWDSLREAYEERDEMLNNIARLETKLKNGDFSNDEEKENSHA